MKYRKKPAVIEAWEWDESETTVRELILLGLVRLSSEGHRDDPDLCRKLVIKTLEGSHIVSPGDWIIQGIKGEFYPCKPDIFEATYEAVEEEDDA